MSNLERLLNVIKEWDNMDIMRQSACLVVNPITVYSYGFIFKLCKKTVDCEYLFIQQLASIAWIHSHRLFSYFILIFVRDKSYKALFRKQRSSRSAMLIRTQTTS